MCGILGGWSIQPVAAQTIRTALSRLLHRGPDDEGVYQSGPAFLGMRRLSIIDLARGHQPISNEDGTITVVFNGEIYNYKELISSLKCKGHSFKTDSDTEVLVHLYEDHGAEMVNYLRGMFAFALLDSRKDNLFLARDRFGKKPLYYAHDATRGSFYFASEIKALRILCETAKRWCVRSQSIYDYLSLGVVPQPYTIYNEVSALPAASWAVFDGCRLKIQPYWKLEYGRPSEITLSDHDLADKTRHLIKESVAIRLRSDVPLGVFLSGGLDSSIVAFEASRVLGENLRSFTIAADDPALDESGIARRTAKSLGIQNVVLPLRIEPLKALEWIVDQYDQPFADSSAIPSYEVSRLAREHVKVVLNGDGGDELFAGYRRYLAASQARYWRLLPAGMAAVAQAILSPLARARRSRFGFAARFLRGLTAEPGRQYLTWTTDMLTEADKEQCWQLPAMKATEAWLESISTAGMSDVTALLARDAHVILLSDLLVKMDIATMSVSLEARSPFLDHVLAEFAAGLSPQILLMHHRTKGFLRETYKGLLSNEVLMGAKRGFEVPLLKWLGKDFRPVILDTIGRPGAKIDAFLDRKWIDNVIAQRTLQDRNWGYIMYALLVLELWLRRADV